MRQMITVDIPGMVAEDTAFRNARENSDRENARIEHDKALGRVMTSIMKDDTELFRQFVDNEDFKRWLGGVCVWGWRMRGWGHGKRLEWSYEDLDDS